jgi:hypothetical protein
LPGDDRAFSHADCSEWVGGVVPTRDADGRHDYPLSIFSTIFDLELS